MIERSKLVKAITAKSDEVKYRLRPNRISFGNIKELEDVPYLLDTQIQSFDWLIGNEKWKKRVATQSKDTDFTLSEKSGLEQVFEEMSPIEDTAQTMSLSFSDPKFDDPKYTIEECKRKDYTYSAPLYVNAEFVNYETGEIKSQTVFISDFPLMTKYGTFVVNGAERVVVSQLVRSPGVYFEKNTDKLSFKELYSARVIPSRGAWLEFEFDKKDTLGVRIDRRRRQSIIVFLQAIGVDKKAIAKAFKKYPEILAQLEREGQPNQEKAMLDLFRKTRPGEPATLETAKAMIQNFFFNPKRYDLSRIGRYKINKKLGVDLDVNESVIQIEDIVATLK
jgi:DNA-directed RNA polymerase subunit beta